jgi:hypothetical protein
MVQQLHLFGGPAVDVQIDRRKLFKQKKERLKKEKKQKAQKKIIPKEARTYSPTRRAMHFWAEYKKCDECGAESGMSCMQMNEAPQRDPCEDRQKRIACVYCGKVGNCTNSKCKDRARSVAFNKKRKAEKLKKKEEEANEQKTKA